MRIIAVALVLGFLGIVVTRVSVGSLARSESPPDAHAYWALGLVSLVPSWLVASFGLLGTTPGQRPEALGAAAWILSGAAGLVGAIFTEGCVRDAEMLASPLQSWRIGLIGFLIAWAIAVGTPLVRLAWT